MTDLILFWHRRDLRISDNIGLSKAREKSHKIIGCFCLDPNILQADDIAPARVSYLLGCLAELSKKKNITKIVFDRGPYLYHGRIKALADGARAGGLQF